MSNERPFLDLTRYRFKRTVGEYTIFGTWVPNGEDTEPALAIIPAFGAIVKPAVIALSAVFKYDDPRYLANMAGYFRREMGFADSLSGACSLANLINDHMSDLISMPPEPTEEVIGADVTMKSNGKTQIMHIVDHVPARMD